MRIIFRGQRFASVTMIKTKLTCDIFCDVIDNYGDAGVCWRLARDIYQTRGWNVRLFINDLPTLGAITEGLKTQSNEQKLDGIAVLKWEMAEREQPGDVVIETFGCRLPAVFEQKIAQKNTTPVWINLEYLSAEDWVEGCHTLPSPHPQYGTKKYYFFPGVTSKTGGLIIEENLKKDREVFLKRKKSFLKSLGADTSINFNQFVFCYPQAPLELFVKALAKDGRDIQLLLAAGRSASMISALTKDIPFIKAIHLSMCRQEHFDRFLWVSDSAIIRGEDSFARAQIEGCPFIWNIYPQTEETHLTKLKAFSLRLKGIYSSEDFELWQSINLAFNTGDTSFVDLWKQWRNRLGSMHCSSIKWSDKIHSLGSLTQNLCKFIESKLKS